MRHINIENYKKIQDIIDEKVKNHKPYNTIDLELLKNLFCDNGLNISEVSKTMGHTNRTIPKYIEKYNFIKGIKSVSDEKKFFIDSVKKLHNEGCGTREIAKIMKCSRGKVEYIVNPQYWGSSKVADRKCKHR